MRTPVLVYHRLSGAPRGGDSIAGDRDIDGDLNDNQKGYARQDTSRRRGAVERGQQCKDDQPGFGRYGDPGTVWPCTQTRKLPARPVLLDDHEGPNAAQPSSADLKIPAVEVPPGHDRNTHGLQGGLHRAYPFGRG